MVGEAQAEAIYTPLSSTCAVQSWGLTLTACRHLSSANELILRAAPDFTAGLPNPCLGPRSPAARQQLPRPSRVHPELSNAGSTAHRWRYCKNGVDIQVFSPLKSKDGVSGRGVRLPTARLSPR